MTPITRNFLKERFNRVGLALQRLQKGSVRVEEHASDAQTRIVVFALL